MTTFQGVVVPLLTPLAPDGTLDRTALSRYLDFLIANGAGALFALSSTGEFCALSWSFQCRLVEAVLECTQGRVPVCAGVSSQRLQDSIERARDMAALGVQAVVALPPFYFRTSQSEMRAFFSRIADASTAPLILYNMPFRTQHVIEPDTVFALREHGHIIGLKDSVGDVDRTLRLASALRGDPHFSYLHGNELLTIQAARAGAHGCVPSLANIAPGFLAQAWARAARSDSDAADQDRIAALMQAFSLLEDRPQDSTTLRLMALKAILSELGIMTPAMAQLAPEMTPEWRARAQAFIARHNLRPDGSC